MNHCKEIAKLLEKNGYYVISVIRMVNDNEDPSIGFDINVYGVATEEKEEGIRKLLYNYAIAISFQETLSLKDVILILNRAKTGDLTYIDVAIESLTKQEISKE